MFRKFDRNKKNLINLCLFKEDIKNEIRKTKEVRNIHGGEFAEISTEEQDKYFGRIPSKEWRYWLDVRFDEKTLESYDGVIVCKTNDFESCEIIKIDSGDVYTDVEIALDVLFDLEGDVEVTFLSHYDWYTELYDEKYNTENK